MSLLSQLGISVDGFTLQDPHCMYLLTHCHADHINGLRPGWGSNPALPIYCSSVTRYLINSTFPSLRCHVLPLNEPQILTHPRYAAGQSTEQSDIKPNQTFNPSIHVRLTLFDSNHCPGSVMILIEHQSKRILHTGDVRFDPVKFHSSVLHQSIDQSIDLMIIDATFGHPNYTHFPSKTESSEVCLKVIQQYLANFLMKNQPSSKQNNQSNNQSNYCHACASHDLSPQIYLVCDCLGVEQLLASVCKATGFKLCFEPPNNQPISQSMRLRMRQLRSMADLRPHVADPNYTHRSLNQFNQLTESNKLIYATAARGFTRFVNQDQADRKKRYDQMKESANQSDAVPKDVSSNQTSQSTCSCPFRPSLYIKPSTLYFARHHARNIQPNDQSIEQSKKGKRSHSMFVSDAFTDPEHKQPNNELYDNDTYDEASDFPSQSNNQSIHASTSPYCQVDRWGVTHILYSMHSSCNEIIRLIDFIGPKRVSMHSVPVVFDGVHRATDRSNDEDVDESSRVRKLMDDQRLVKQFQSMLDAALPHRARRVIVQQNNLWVEDDSERKETTNQTVKQTVNESFDFKPFNRSQSEKIDSKAGMTNNHFLKQTNRSTTVLDSYYARRSVQNPVLKSPANTSNKQTSDQFHKARHHLFDFSLIKQVKLHLAKNVRGDTQQSISQTIKQLKADICDCFCLSVRLVLIDSTKRSCSVLIDRLMRKIVCMKHDRQKQHGLMDHLAKQTIHIYDVKCLNVLMEGLTLHLGGLSNQTSDQEIDQAIKHLYEDVSFVTELHSHFVWSSFGIVPAKVDQILEEHNKKTNKAMG